MLDYSFDNNRKFRRIRRSLDDFRRDFVSPKSIDKLFVWYDATRIDTITKDGSNFISEWKDLGLYGFHLTNSDTNSTKPIYVSSGINSRPSISFDGNDYLETSNIYGISSPASKEWLGIFGDFFGHRRQTYIWVCLPSAATSTYKTWRMNSGSNDCCFFSRHTSFSDNPLWSYNNSLTLYDEYSNTLNPQNDTTNAHMWRFSKNSFYDDVYFQIGWLYIDEQESSLVTSQVLDQSDAEFFNLGCGDVSNGYEGQIAEFIIYNKLLNSRECFYIKSYLRSKWNI